VKFLYSYPELCSGCRQCSISCALNKFGECNPKKGAINVIRDEFERYEMPVVCVQCDEPACVAVCVKSAITRDESGIIKIDKDKCIGCRMCVAACPFGAVFSFKGDIIKCDLCDGEPVCINYCSTNALVYEEETEELQRRRKELTKIVLKQS
jgi:Fe-S-cluster-containing hydrogenase component 2